MRGDTLLLLLLFYIPVLGLKYKMIIKKKRRNNPILNTKLFMYDIHLDL